MVTQDEVPGDVLEELFGGSRESFLETRTEHVKQARAAGDRELAKRITAIRKPTVAAWLVNRLVRQYPDELADVEELAAELADAHRHGSGERLRAAGERRRDLLRHLENRVREVAGQRVGDDIVTQVTTTFQAALIDPAALAAVRSGRLSSAIELGADLLDQWPTSDITASPRPAAAPPAKPKQPDPRLAAARDRLTAATQAREQAESALADAQRSADAAERKLAKARAAFDAARDAHDGAREAVTSARSALSGAVRSEHAAGRAVTELTAG